MYTTYVLLKNCLDFADLYSVWMAPRFKSNVFVETWQNGGGRNLHSNCTGQYKVRFWSFHSFCQERMDGHSKRKKRTTETMSKQQTKAHTNPKNNKIQ